MSVDFSQQTISHVFFPESLNFKSGGKSSSCAPCYKLVRGKIEVKLAR